MPNKTLFIGLGNSAPCWYRCGLPGIYLGDEADWIGYAGNPASGGVIAGSLDTTKIPDIDPYDAIVIQQPSGEDWLNHIKGWQRAGKKIIFECDDFLHGVKKVENHTYQKSFNKKRIKEFEACMRQADAMICSTEFLSKQYEKYNANQHVCLVGLDTKRYNVEFPARNQITIGWAGGTGHDLAIAPWLEVVSRILERHPHVAFCSIGTNYAQILAPYHPHRCLSIPWVSIENLPYALTNFDIEIAPAHESKYHLAKSDLRWLEASALGIPVVADSRLYSSSNNFGLVDSPEEAEDELEMLIYSEYDRKTFGETNKTYVQKHRDINETVDQWREAITAICQA